jgi:drug/metabolite transporter (DMT)-like permease
MPGILTGTVAALAASAFYAVGVALQAVEARVAPPAQALRLALFRRLVARRRWLAGTGMGLAGWALQTFALTRAPLTLVQPLLGASLVFLLVIAIWQLGEHVHRLDVIAVVAIAAAVPLLARTAPERQAVHAGGARLWATLAILGAAALSPFVLRGVARATSILVPVGAGLAYSWDSLATKFAADDYARHLWPALALWFVAMNAASGLGTLSEMSALQRRPVSQVAPMVFALTAFVPVALAPLVAREWWPVSTWRVCGLVLSLALIGGGALRLARSKPIARVLAAEATSSSSETPRSPREESSAATVASSRPA